MQLLKRGGKCPLQTKWLPVYKAQMFWTWLWNATQNFLMFSRATSSLGSGWFFERTVLEEWGYFEVVHLELTACFPDFKHLMSRDAVPTATPFQWWAACCPCLTGRQGPVTSFFSTLHLGNNAALKKDQTHVRVRMGKSNSNFNHRKRDEMVPNLDKKRGMILTWEILWALVVQVVPGED